MRGLLWLKFGEYFGSRFVSFERGDQYSFFHLLLSRKPNNIRCSISAIDGNQLIVEIRAETQVDRSRASGVVSISQEG